MKTSTMTITRIPTPALGPTDDDRDVAIGRLTHFHAAHPLDIMALERETALHDAAIEFGAALQQFVPAGERREQAWIAFEDAFFRGIQGISTPKRPQEAP